MAASQLFEWQVKAIYAIASSLKMIEHGSHEDALHSMVEGLTGKKSVKALTSAEASQVQAELQSRMKLTSQASIPNIASKKEHSEIAGGVTAAQQRKVWAFMYELKKWDTQQIDAAVGERLQGIIKRQFSIDAPLKEPFRFLNFEQGRELIEYLKHYVTTAELKYLRKKGGQ